MWSLTPCYGTKSLREWSRKRIHTKGHRFEGNAIFSAKTKLIAFNFLQIVILSTSIKCRNMTKTKYLTHLGYIRITTNPLLGKQA